MKNSSSIVKSTKGRCEYNANFIFPFEKKIATAGFKECEQTYDDEQVFSIVEGYEDVTISPMPSIRVFSNHHKCVGKNCCPNKFIRGGKKDEIDTAELESIFDNDSSNVLEFGKEKKKKKSKKESSTSSSSSSSSDSSSNDSSSSSDSSSKSSSSSSSSSSINIDRFDINDVDSDVLANLEHIEYSDFKKPSLISDSEIDNMAFSAVNKNNYANRYSSYYDDSFNDENLESYDLSSNEKYFIKSDKKNRKF